MASWVTQGIPHSSTMYSQSANLSTSSEFLKPKVPMSGMEASMLKMLAQKRPDFWIADAVVFSLFTATLSWAGVEVTCSTVLTTQP